MDTLAKFEILRRIDGARILVDFEKANELKLDEASSEEEGWGKIIAFRRMLNAKKLALPPELEEAEIDYYPVFSLEGRVMAYKSDRIFMLIGFDQEKSEYRLMVEPNSEHADEWLFFWAGVLFLYGEKFGSELSPLGMLKDRLFEVMATKISTNPLGDGDKSLSLAEAKQISALLGEDYPAMKEWQKAVNGRYLN